MVCHKAKLYLANLNGTVQIIFNPGAFIDVIKCACVDTFQAVFPQCVDWCVHRFEQDIRPISEFSG